MGFFGGGGGGAGATVQPIKPVPPPAQMSASLSAVRTGKQAASAMADAGGTILAGGAGADILGLPSPANLLYNAGGGKKLTGA